jgi:hypothetical protein
LIEKAQLNDEERRLAEEVLGEQQATGNQQ